MTTRTDARSAMPARAAAALAGAGAGLASATAVLALASAVLALAAAAPVTAIAQTNAGTSYVDGISDQSMPAWDGGFAASGFAEYFGDRWVDEGHIAYARYAVQWNVMQEPSAGANAFGDYRERLEAWYEDASSLGLILDLALTSYDSSTPRDTTQYGQALVSLLQALPDVRYVEAWNEPNNHPYLQPPVAAHLADTAMAVCRARATCTAIVGDLLDSPNEVAYERSYERSLLPADPSDWAIHPYFAVKQLSEAPVREFERNLPHAGGGIQTWFTEVGAYYCDDFASGPQEAGEERQATAAFWLTHLLMPDTHPAHVFYFELLYGQGQPPPCTRAQADTALYVPDERADRSDRPRKAAAMILGEQMPDMDRAGPPAGAGAQLGNSSLSVLPF